MQFEDKIIANILYDDEFANKVVPYTKDEYFDGNYKTIIRTIVDFYIKYGTTPTKDELKIEIGQLKGLTDHALKEINDTIDAITRDHSDKKWLIETTEKFYRDRSLTNAIISGATILEKKGKDTNKILDMVQKALSVSFDSNLGHDYFANANDRFDAYHIKEDKIPTGISTFDKITLGGFSRKSLNCVIASTGCHGKGTKVFLTDQTIKNVEDVVVGDQLIGPDGDRRQVLELRRGIDTMYQIKPRYGRSYTVNGHHIVPLIDITTNQYVEKTVNQLVNEDLSKYVIIYNDKEIEFDRGLTIEQRYQILGEFLNKSPRYLQINYVIDLIGKSDLEYIMTIAGSLGIHPICHYVGINGVDHWYVCLMGENCKNIPKTWHDRATHNNNYHRQHFTITKVGDDQPYYGFVVDKDHLYYSDDWVLQHNSGKTLLMCSTACDVIRQGYNVLYISLEMSEVRIAERMDANLLKLTIPSLGRISLQQYSDRIDDLKRHKHGKLMIKEFPTSTASVLHFKNLLNELRLKHDFVPDLICVDYINLMTSSRYKPGQTNSYGMVKAISEELRGLAVEYNVAILTATQTNRAGINNSDIEMTEVSDSIGITFTLDMMFALIRNEELDKLNQVAIKQLKNRYSDLNNIPYFYLGIDRDTMRVYDLDQPQVIEPSPQTFMPARSVGSKPKNDFSKFTF